jgi:hypothetical protein
MFRRRGVFFALEPPLDHDRTFLVVVVEHLAMQALDAFVGVYMPFGMDRLNGAFVAAALAWTAAFTVAPQPIEQTQARWYRHGRAHRAQIAAEGALDEQT